MLLHGVENHQKLVVCLCASLQYECYWMVFWMKNTFFAYNRNIHLFFTQFLQRFRYFSFSVNVSNHKYMCACLKAYECLSFHFVSKNFHRTWWQSRSHCTDFAFYIPQYRLVRAIYGDAWFTHSYSNIIETFMQQSTLCRFKKFQRRNQPHPLLQLYRIVFQFQCNNGARKEHPSSRSLLQMIYTHPHSFLLVLFVASDMSIIKHNPAPLKMPGAHWNFLTCYSSILIFFLQ